VTTRIANALILSLCLSFGLIDGYFLVKNQTTPRAFDLAFAAVVMITGYFWYRRDSILQEYQGSVFLGGAIILFVPIATPIYLALSRAPGKKLKSVFLYLAFLVVALLVGVGTTNLVAVASGA
jgi:uncharacterized protein YneF (UPF0154 family)